MSKASKALAPGTNVEALVVGRQHHPTALCTPVFWHLTTSLPKKPKSLVTLLAEIHARGCL